MNKQIITFSADEQKLVKTGGINCYASNIVSYIEAHFALGQNWSGYDSVRAVWSNDNNMTVISTVLDSNGHCLVPFEVLKTMGVVKVNLVGSISVSDVLTDRLTTFPCEAVKVARKAKINGSETAEITPSQFEQFVANVRSDAERAAQSAEDAAESASDAAASASDASDSATDAASSATAAAASATAASGYADNAQTSASAASGSADSASQSAIVAAASASSAASASATASQYADSASASATSAAGYAESAAISAGDAGDAAQNAAESAEDAAASAQTAEDAKDTILGMTLVTDVQTDGTSIVDDGVADIPVAESNIYGVIKAGTTTVGTDNYSAVRVGIKSSGTAKNYSLAQTTLASTSTRGLMSASDKSKLNSIAQGAEINVQSDWDVANSTSDAYIKNKPTIPSKTSDLTNDVPFVEMSDLSSLLPTDTASGAIASFPDGQSVIPAVSVVAEIEPIQSGSGTPSPDNVRPISGRTEVVTSLSPYEQTEKHTITGKNLYNAPNNQNGVLVPCHIENGQTVVASCGGSGAGIRYYNANKTQIDYWTLTQQSDDRYYRSFTASGGIEYVQFYGADSTDYMVEIGTSTPSPYEPYGTTHTTSLGRTVYGGEVEIVGGSLTDKMGMVDLGTLTWLYSDGLFRSQVPNFAEPSSYVERRKGFILSAYSADTQISISADAMTDGTALRLGGLIYIKDTRFTDATSFKSAVSGVQLVYELATPQTYQLTPQEVEILKGQNNIWSDSGVVEVTYKADVGLYIDKKLNV